MKNILKIAIVWFLIWEIVASIYKDEEFRKKISENEDIFVKFKVIINELLRLNKQLFIDLKEKDYQAILAQIEDNIQLLKDNLDEINSEKIKPIVDKITIKIQQIKDSLDTVDKNSTSNNSSTK